MLKTWLYVKPFRQYRNVTDRGMGRIATIFAVLTRSKQKKVFLIFKSQALGQHTTSLAVVGLVTKFLICNIRT